MSLHEIPLDDLFAELERRNPAGVLVTIIPENNNSCETRCYSWGNRATRIGLLHAALSQETKRFLETLHPNTPDPEDD